MGVLLTEHDLADELGISHTEADRLIARQKLKATELGNGGEWRVTKAALEDYVAAGCKDLRLPELAGTWFSNKLVPLADMFEAAVIDAAQEQVPSDDELRKILESSKTDTTSFLIAVTGAVAAVLQAPVPGPSFGSLPIGTKADTRFAKWSDLYATVLIRNAARSLLLAAGNGIGTPLQVLYENPRKYLGVAAQAYQRAAQRRIVFSCSVVVGGRFYAASPVARTAQFSLPVSSFMTEKKLAELIGLAF